LPAVLDELRDLLDLSALTLAGESLGERPVLGAGRGCDFDVCGPPARASPAAPDRHTGHLVCASRRLFPWRHAGVLQAAKLLKSQRLARDRILLATVGAGT
jgi:hypothetical protein